MEKPAGNYQKKKYNFNLFSASSIYRLINQHRILSFIVVIYFAVLLRAILIPNPGFEADIAFWKSWGMATLDGGIVWALKHTNNNYPTPFSYILGFMNWLYQPFGNAHNFYDYWMNNNTRYLTIAKLLPITADFAIFGLFLLIGKNAKKWGFPAASKTLYFILGTIYILNPVTLIDGAWWGQIDSVGVFVFLSAILLALDRKPFLAGVVYMASMMTKLQNMIYGPLFFLFLWNVMGYRGLIQGLSGAVLAFAGLNIEFILAREFDKVITSLTLNYDYFPWMSLNAYNLWWIVSGAAGMKMSDKVLAIGIINAKKMGLILFSSFYLMAFLGLLTPIFQVIKNKRLIAKKIVMPKISGDIVDPKFSHGVFLFLIGVIIVANAFFLFQTESHDRYAFPMTVFLLLLVPFMTKSEKKLWLFGYVLWSISFFYNLHNALIVNYPKNGMPILSNMNWPSLTITVSIFMILSFGVFLLAVRKHLSFFTYIIPVLAILSGTIFMNLPLITKKPVRLSSFTPVVSEQNYSNRTVDMPTGADASYTKWDRLSVQYAFYKHGIGIHANSVMNYDIGGHFKRFTTDYGIDTQAGSKGTATFEIYGDGKLLFRSEKIGRFDNPKHIEVDITGIKTLGLVTTDAKDGIDDDHTDWLNPLLWP